MPLCERCEEELSGRAARLPPPQFDHENHLVMQPALHLQPMPISGSAAAPPTPAHTICCCYQKEPLSQGGEPGIIRGVLRVTVRLMNDGEVSRLEVPRDLAQRRLTIAAAGQSLGLERRQVFRLLKAYRMEGATGLISKGRGCRSNRRKPDALRRAVLAELLVRDVDARHFRSHAGQCDNHLVVTAAKDRGALARDVAKATRVRRNAGRATGRGGFSPDGARIGPTRPGRGPDLPAATIGLMKVVGHRTGSAFGRALDSEPDLLAVGELERMAVGVGDARDIADRVADIDRGAGRPALATSFGIEPVDLLAARAGNAKMTEWPERRIVLLRGFDQHNDEGSGVVGEPSRADALAGRRCRTAMRAYFS